MNAELQRIRRSDKKDVLSDLCKEIEVNNRMGKSRDPFKIIRDNKGILHAKMGTIKDRNGNRSRRYSEVERKHRRPIQKISS